MKTALLILVATALSGCAAPLTGRPLTWAQIQRVGELHVEDPSWKGNLLRLPIRIDRAETESPVALQFKAASSDNLIYLTASRDLSDNPPAEVCEALVELPNPRLQEYYVVYAEPGGGYERLRAVQIPETLQEKLGLPGGRAKPAEASSPAQIESPDETNSAAEND